MDMMSIGLLIGQLALLGLAVLIGYLFAKLRLLEKLMDAEDRREVAEIERDSLRGQVRRQAEIIRKKDALIEGYRKGARK